MPSARRSRVATAAALAGAVAAAVTLTACGNEPARDASSRKPASAGPATPSPRAPAFRTPRPVRVGVPFALGSAQAVDDLVALGPGSGGAARFATVPLDGQAATSTMVVSARVGEPPTAPRRLITAGQAIRAEATTFLPDGTSLVVFGTAAQERIDAAQIDATGRAADPVRVTVPRGNPGWERELATAPVVGPTGAVAELFEQALASGYAGPVLAFRPAGASAFGAPIPLGTGVRGDGEFHTVAMSPDGGAFVVGAPFNGSGRLPFAQHISPAGAIGPLVDLGTAALGFRTRMVGNYMPVDAVVAQNGTLTVALSLESPNVGIERGPPTLAVASMTPGASEASAHKLGIGVSDDNPDPVLSLAAGPGGHVALLARDGHRGLAVYEGSGTTAFTRTSSIRAPAVTDAQLFGDPDGSLRVAWLRQYDTGRPRGRFMGTSRSPHGAFEAPHALSGSQLARGSIGPTLFAQLPHGRVAVAYLRYPYWDDEHETWFGLIGRP